MPVAVSPPRWKWEWNPNTIAVLVGFAAGFVAWGYTLAELKTGRDINAGNIDKLEARIVALETNTRRIDNHELRLTTVERQTTDAATAMKAVEAALSSLNADVKVVREILSRMEKNGQRASADP